MANLDLATDRPVSPAVAQPYPGESATGEDILRLANAYREAALALSKETSVRRPYYLLAIHAIELYLNALLRHEGRESSWVRGMHHDLTTRVQLAVEIGLQLRDDTKLHLATMHAKREYLIARYGPETPLVSKPEQLERILNEVAKKVEEKLHGKTKPGAGHNHSAG